MRLRLSLAAILWVSVLMGSAIAGSICGIVRDANTSQPVSNAGVFLYQNDVYANLHGVSDVAGLYCVDDVPNGSYDLVVRVNNYETARINGVLVDSATAVDILSSAPAEFDAPFPNPSSGSVALRYRLGRAMPVRIEIFNLRGQRVRSWGGPAPAGQGEVRWDFRDSSGQSVVSGSYVVRFSVEDRVLLRTIHRIK